MYDMHSVSAVIVAGGSSSRMGFDKLEYLMDGKSVLQRSIEAFLGCEAIDEIIVVTSKHLAFVQDFSRNFAKKIVVVPSGAQRVNSVQNGVNSAKCEYVAIHDAARPFVSEKTILNTLRAAILHGAAAPCVPLKDTVKLVSQDMCVQKTPERSRLFAVQTPQIFKTAEYKSLSKELAFFDGTDDCGIYEQSGKKVVLVEGEYENIKITTIDDIKERRKMRIGHGYDVHKLAENRDLILGGVKIPYEKGLLGHSDADVLCHAIMDAMLGAAAMGDIGKLFPDTAKEYEGANSIELLCQVQKELQKKGFFVQNVDATMLCQKPKLREYIDEMRENIARAIKINIDYVSVKATTEEGLGFTGSGEGIAAHAVVLI